ncbi:pyruvate dehydrogenase E2 component (dihydrolipoamide acetyltransferase) [Lewinella marina]|uniref:Acetyltransferase component of pyruvate dehydrogenase complex n=1 Tax=Neolewinella marina TaxID=438751 RepID=A0A2G0CHE0_9BACT|nr:pyruvate dehydrogenase complex dihydrolipoamide acetyltransferase [Neolewinella marina]NJB86144.1 pyruvate dehydrogenase E2 component (dihydrolipoamide acetyltransferase) [Neolewinella marina]PHK99378.1 pyruvate dehydrogenase complex dihydrolipoamide acetyltransferase [Neolewinella marina]
MAEVIRMPRMSDTMEEGNIVAWLVEEGDAVEPGQTLAEVETDKATMELDSFFEGTLLHIAVKEGAVPIDGVIAVIGEEGEDWKAAIEGAGNGSSGEAASGPSDSAESDNTAPAEAAPATPGRTTTDEQGGDDRLKASPLARAMAKEAGIDLKGISGTGEGGRIVKRDVEEARTAPAPAAQPQTAQPAPAPAQQPSPNVTVEQPAAKVPGFSFGGGEANFEQTTVSQMRKVIARRLGESKFTAPHFYVTVEIEMSKVWELRKRINEVAPVKISFNDLVVKACAVNLPKHPAINSSWQGDHIRVNKDVNIGVAVAIPDGLLVPVIRYANMKSLSQINTEVKELAGRAKNKKLSQDEMTGNTFTISNLGMFGIEEFTAIINPPDACILAVGGINDKPVVRDGEVVPGKIMKVTLSSDHRVVDGASAAGFLNDVKATLEDPIRLMV